VWGLVVRSSRVVVISVVILVLVVSVVAWRRLVWWVLNLVCRDWMMVSSTFW